MRILACLVFLSIASTSQARTVYDYRHGQLTRNTSQVMVNPYGGVTYHIDNRVFNFPERGRIRFINRDIYRQVQRDVSDRGEFEDDERRSGPLRRLLSRGRR